MLKEKPDYGINMGQGFYKIPMAITSKDKSGGARVITCLITEDNEVYLVFIYDKSQLENITKEQILEMIKKAGHIK